MKEVVATITIDRSASHVFGFTIDPANTAKWVDGIATEQTNEYPTRPGTIYRNQGHDGSWAEFEITAFEAGKMFEMTKLDDNHHVQYTFNPVSDTQCELVCRVWVADGEIADRFSQKNIQSILQDLKTVIESTV